MKTIEIDDDLYQYIARQTCHIGEDASSILRRLLAIESYQVTAATPTQFGDFSALVALVKSDEFVNQKKLVNRFLSILAVLYTCNHSLFSVAAASLHGSKRRYLADDEQTLLRSGNNTKPKLIPNTPYWVVTNSNTARKIFIIESLMNTMEVPDYIIGLVKTQFVAK
ncbi:negative regulator of replication initiation SeqA [Orbus hercynius]|uniref:Negative modulator of initiation of replication n=1 Tax=Orbus hercynius TaxID=593135 RepID=A0A495RDS6_9GAMM|nr:replication initiation regulator SeqA [Orbus hercynius]RKS85098.1 negative regulator of replication initiation SeqA [Orbus hercynius]